MPGILEILKPKIIKDCLRKITAKMQGGKSTAAADGGEGAAADYAEVLAWTKRMNSTPSGTVNELLGMSDEESARQRRDVR